MRLSEYVVADPLIIQQCSLHVLCVCVCVRVCVCVCVPANRQGQRCMQLLLGVLTLDWIGLDSHAAPVAPQWLGGLNQRPGHNSAYFYTVLLQ